MTALGRLDSVSRVRAISIIIAGLLPWALIPYEAGTTYVFSFGLVEPIPGPVSIVPVTRYLLVETRGLPPSLLAWPLAGLLYVLGVASAALSVVDMEDRRVSAGLFALAAIDLAYFAYTFSAWRIGVYAIPLGVVTLAAAAWTSRP